MHKKPLQGFICLEKKESQQKQPPTTPTVYTDPKNVKKERKKECDQIPLPKHHAKETVKVHTTRIGYIPERGFQQEASRSSHDTVGTAINQALSPNLRLLFPMKRL